MTSSSPASVCSTYLTPAVLQVPKDRIYFLLFWFSPCRSCRERWGRMWHRPGEAKYWGALWLCEACAPEREPRDDVRCPAQGSHSRSQTLSAPGCQLDAEARETQERITKRYWLVHSAPFFKIIIISDVPEACQRCDCVLKPLLQNKLFIFSGGSWSLYVAKSCSTTLSPAGKNGTFLLLARHCGTHPCSDIRVLCCLFSA